MDMRAHIFDREQVDTVTLRLHHPRMPGAAFDTMDEVRP